MRWKSIAKGLSLILSLVALSLILCGCDGDFSPQQKAEFNKKVMESLRKRGVGDENNRNLFNDPEYRSGYEKGYEKGYKEGARDYRREETYSPTITKFKSGRNMYDEGHSQGYADGYYHAFEANMRIEEEAKQLPSSEEDTGEADKESDDYTIFSDYEQGYEYGYEKGHEVGLLDRNNGYEYRPTPWSTYYGSEESQRGFKDGYAAGYDAGYKGN